MPGPPPELPPEALRRTCDPSSLRFDTTAALPTLGEVLGQPRAVAALEFGASMASHGFNLFALGQTGSGKTTLIREYLERRAASEPVPDDLCYVNNFADARRPLPLRLPAGLAARFKQDIDALVDELKVAIPRAFDSQEYSTQRDKIVQGVEERRREELTRMEQLVEKAGFQLLKGPGGLLLAPAPGGKPLTDQDLEQLAPEDREKVDRARERLQREIEDRLRVLRDLEKDARAAMRALDKEAAAGATRHAIDDLRARYGEQPAVLSYLEALQEDVLEHIAEFRKGKETEAPPLPIPLPPGTDQPFARYEVNVLVDNSRLRGAPVLVESNPTYLNLTGRIEHQATWGGIYTNHTMIKAGALHRANGGYLIVPARECLLNPFAWEGLKRALKDRELRIEQAGAQIGIASAATLDPEPVPLNAKVVLIGSPQLYYLLYAYDEDFQKLFKVKADFTTRMDRTPESEHAYALFVATITQQEKSAPFDRGAVARVIDYGSRAAADQDQLSTRFGDIADLIREAAHRAAGDSRSAVTAEDVRAAEEARRYRQNLLEERLQESILKGTVLLETTGAAVGRVNGLSVLSMGDYAFGHPARITATVAPGRRGVVSIEREVELSGPIHGKGVLILSGYLLRRYGQTGHLSLSASLVFEQSYSLVEGDSASLAELCVLLSAVAETPLRQDVAVTGSVNQHGQVQPVGGVAEKIEGFFDVCRARGFTGAQGVLIPAANRRHLMLRDDVVEAVRAGQFHVWAAEQVDEALELLTGQTADGLHTAVSARLAGYTEILRALSAKEEEKKSGDSGS
jgi:lon-related putative ATP-dependent protease